MRYDIIATLGPASRRVEDWQAMQAAGATAFRLNTSHLTLEALQDWLERLAAAHLPAAAPLVLDLQGSKWRLGQFAPFDLIAGQRVELFAGSSGDQAGRLPVPHPDFFKAAPLSNGEIVLNDARSLLVVETIQEDRIVARVARGGTISPHKGITFAACQYRQESLSAKDQAIVALARDRAGTRCALSYVKDGAEMARYREQIGTGVFLIAKLERGPAMQAAPEIARWCDEVWVCRGDLGAEVGLPAMARAVADFSAQLPSLAVPAIMAGQVLEHMTTSPTPTRSEVCYLWDSLQQGYRGFVLSDETATGAHPVESVRAAAMFLPPDL